MRFSPFAATVSVAAVAVLAALVEAAALSFGLEGARVACPVLPLSVFSGLNAATVLSEADFAALPCPLVAVLSCGFASAFISFLSVFASRGA